MSLDTVQINLFIKLWCIKRDLGGGGGEGIGTDLFFGAKIEFSPVTFTSIVKIVRKV